MNTAILKKKIEYWESQLLDLSKRNKMISFRETKRSSIRVIEPGFEEFYDRIVNNEEELSFQKPIGKDYDIRMYSVLSLFDALSAPIEVSIGDIKVSSNSSDTKATLKNLRSKARLSLDEQGTNILYLVFGFVEWHDKGVKNADTWIKSPLILVPVTISGDPLGNNYKLTRYEDDIVVNPTLTYLFERDYGLTMPEFDSDKDNIADFMNQMEKLVDKRGWKINKDCCIGLMSFLKISMYKDLVNNEDNLKKNPIIRAFAGEKNEINSVSGEQYEFDHDKEKSSETFQVVNADSSQQDAIALSKAGISFVMQGPPGTGKSQTITNIIAQGLADGKKILFVSEKMAALEVVYRRLSETHLADFCLSLHSYKANKKEILNELERNLGLQRTKVKDEEIAKLTQLDLLKAELKQYVQDIHREIMPLEMSLYEVYGEISEYDNLPDIPISLPEDISRMSKNDVNKYVLMVANYDSAMNTLGEKWYKNPWQGIVVPFLDGNKKNELKDSIEHALLIIELLSGINLYSKKLADIVSISNAGDYQSIIQKYLNSFGVPKKWYEHSLSNEENLLNNLKNTKETISLLQSEIADSFTSGIYKIDSTTCLSNIKNAVKWLSDNVFVKTDEDSILLSDIVRNSEFDMMCSKLSVLKKYYAEVAAALNIGVKGGVKDFEELIEVCKIINLPHSITPFYLKSDSLSDVKFLEEYLIASFDNVERINGNMGEYNEELYTDPDSSNWLPLVEGALKTLVQCNLENNYAEQFQMAVDKYSVYLDRIKLSAERIITKEKEFGIKFPENIDTAKTYISAIETILSNVDFEEIWKEQSARSKAGELIDKAITAADVLNENKKNFSELAEKLHLNLDLLHLGVDTIKVLELCQENIPESGILLKSYNSDKMKQFMESFRAVKASCMTDKNSIAVLNKKYRIIQSQESGNLAEYLNEHKNDVEACQPFLIWTSGLNEVKTFLDKVISVSRDLNTQYDDICKICEPTVFELDNEAILARFKTEYTNIFKIFKSAYKEDIKSIRLVYKEVRKKIPDDEIIDLLQKLKKYKETLKEYEDNGTRVFEYFGVSNYDRTYNWSTISSRLSLFENISEFFGNKQAAFDFITDKAYLDYISIDERIVGDTEWFAESTGKELFGSRYFGENTDINGIENDIYKVSECAKIFVSAEACSLCLNDAYKLSELSKLKQYICNIIDCREWFSENKADIAKYLDINYQEDYGGWTDTKLNMDKSFEIIKVFGNDVGPALIRIATTEADNLEEYKNELAELLQAKDYYIALCRCNAADVESISLINLIENIERILKSMQAVLGALGYLKNYAVNKTMDIPLDKLSADLKDAVSYRNILNELTQNEKDYTAVLGSDYKGFDTEWNAINANISYAEKVLQLIGDDMNDVIIERLISHSAVYDDKKISEIENLLSELDKIIGKCGRLSKKMPVDDLAKKMEKAAKFSKVLESTVKIISDCMYGQITYSELMGGLSKLDLLEKKNGLYREAIEKTSKLMPFWDISEKTDWNALLAKLKDTEFIRKNLSSHRVDKEFKRFILENADPELTQKVYDAINRFYLNRQHFEDFADLFEQAEEMKKSPVGSMHKKIDNCHNEFSTMDSWIDFRDCREKCCGMGLGKFILKAEDSRYPMGTLDKVFMKAFYYKWLEKIKGSVESTAGFNVRHRIRDVELFRQLDNHQLPVAEARIREKLIKNMPSKTGMNLVNDEMSTLLHEIGKKRKIMPLRKLFRSIPNLLLKLKPCLMMSPLSVAYFLEAETYKFDMVIFDEASQIFPQDAIGAIFRGAQVIIAGDSKQLPPTNFFSSSTSNNDDIDDDEEYFISDSILEEATSTLPNRSLLWHYRSRSEDLIAFSNKKIYKNKLITFPGNSIDTPDFGVEYVYVKDGIYENRSNRREAEKCVELVRDHFMKHPERSLGIIAFSESQQSVIEDEIQKFRVNNPFFEEYFDENREAPFFVKNLENVQGDERDTIIFSICYGKNTQGKMYMRFGPLGQQGGERRLNVAITRAKDNVKLVGSIMPEDIDISKTKADGVLMLRSYIDYAMRGTDVLAEHYKKNEISETDTFAECVGSFIKMNGYNIKMNLGNSDYTIDIAVEHPKKKGIYFAGVECDGYSYQKARTVRDREHLRTAVLNNMGWNMFRVWSTEWINNPEGEKQRLLQFLKSALQSTSVSNLEETLSEETAVAVETITINTDEQVDADNPFGLELYEESDCYDADYSNSRTDLDKVVTAIMHIVSVEQPIHKELLYKRLQPMFAGTNMTAKMKQSIDSVINYTINNVIEITDGFVSLKGAGVPKVRRSVLGSADRKIDQIAIEEISEAIKIILKNSIGIERDDLIVGTARIFGFTNTGPKIKERINTAIDDLVHNNIIKIVDGKINLMEG